MNGVDWFALGFDCETVGQNIEKNPTIAIGVALVNQRTNKIHIESDGTICQREWQLPMLAHEELDQQNIEEFWGHSEMTKQQLKDWKEFDKTNTRSRDEIVNEFIDFVDRICTGKMVELVVDTAAFDVSRISKLLCSTKIDNNPFSWHFILKHPHTQKRIYSRITEVNSWYNGHLVLDPPERVRRGIYGMSAKHALMTVYRIPQATFEVTKDHYCSNDAALMVLDYVYIKNFLKSYF